MICKIVGVDMTLSPFYFPFWWTCKAVLDSFPLIMASPQPQEQIPDSKQTLALLRCLSTFLFFFFFGSILNFFFQFDSIYNFSLDQWNRPDGILSNHWIIGLVHKSLLSEQ